MFPERTKGSDRSSSAVFEASGVVLRTSFVFFRVSSKKVPDGYFSSSYRALGWPIVADAVSGPRVPRPRASTKTPKPPVVYHFDHVLLGAQTDPARTSLAPDVVLQLGSRVTSKRTSTFLDGLPLRAYILVDSHPFRHDPSHVLSHRVEMGIATFVDAVLEGVETTEALTPPRKGGLGRSNGVGISVTRQVNGVHQDSSPEGPLSSRRKPESLNGSGSTQNLVANEPTKRIRNNFEHAEPNHSALSEYGRMLVELSEAVGREIATCLEEEEELSEPHVARIVAGSIAAEGALFLGNSMAIRVRITTVRNEGLDAKEGSRLFGLIC